jgi:hypothetical protein
MSERAVGGGDENVAQFVVVACADLHDTRIIGTGRTVSAHHQLQLGGDAGVGIRRRDGVEACLGRLAETRHLLPGRSVGDQGGGAGSTHQPLGRKVIGVGITGAISGADANTTSGADSLAGRLDQRLVD